MTKLHLVAWTPKGVSPIPLCRRNGSIRAFAWVDDEDFARFGQSRWYLNNGYARRLTYVPAQGRQFHTVLHREILGLRFGDPLQGDHINQFRLDNRRSNLRVCRHEDNAQNHPARRSGSSKHRGVYWRRDLKKWGAEVFLDNKHNHLGYFTEEAEAAEAAREFRSRHMPYAVR